MNYVYTDQDSARIAEDVEARHPGCVPVVDYQHMNLFYARAIAEDGSVIAHHTYLVRTGRIERQD